MLQSVLRLRRPNPKSEQGTNGTSVYTPPLDRMIPPTEEPPSLLTLPPEILHQILSCLSCESLVSLTRTSRYFHDAAYNDLLWSNLLRPNIPTFDFPHSLVPGMSYRSLYIAHHPYWFLPRHRLWFSDDEHYGKLMVVHFSALTGAISGHRLLSQPGDHFIQPWSVHPGVSISFCSPHTHIFLDDPVLSLEVDPPPHHSNFKSKKGWWEGEIKMRTGRRNYSTGATFFLSRNIPQSLQTKSMALWPPMTIPNMPRVRSVSQGKFRGKGHKPQSYEEISQTTFRMRHWSQFSMDRAFFGVRMAEQVSTWSTLDERLWRPTKEKPWQGIWVGDYPRHGCEFLLVLQSDGRRVKRERHRQQAAGLMDRYFNGELDCLDDDDEEDDTTSPRGDPGQRMSSTPNSSLLDDELSGYVNASSSTTAAAEKRTDIYKGALEAIKLTGDVHIPRGEITFVADDIGSKGFVRTATEEPFSGARIVKSRGHVAMEGFKDDEFMPSQLIMISHDLLAQHWIPMARVSYYHRVNLDDLMRKSYSQNETVRTTTEASQSASG